MVVARQCRTGRVLDVPEEVRSVILYHMALFVAGALATYGFECMIRGGC